MCCFYKTQKLTDSLYFFMLNKDSVACLPYLSLRISFFVKTPCTKGLDCRYLVSMFGASEKVMVMKTQIDQALVFGTIVLFCVSRTC